MFNFLWYFSFFFFINETITQSLYEYNEDILSNNSFLYAFFIFFVINFNFNLITKTDKFDLDLLYKLFCFLLRTPSIFVNYCINILKKIYIYLIHFKYKRSFNTVKIFLKNYSHSIFLYWRPLFKKTSYFGYYRSNRSKWIK